MKAALVLSFATLIASVSVTANGAVFERDWKTLGDGLLTYDDVNQRLWLDLTETQLFKFPGDTLEEKFQSVLEAVELGGILAEFSVASGIDVDALAESAGINTMTLDFETNQAAASTLIEYVGETRDFGDESPNRAASGLLKQTTNQMAADILFGPQARDHAFAGFEVTPFVGIDSGVWLYRPIPEPSALMLFFLAMIGALGVRRCR